MYAAGGAAIHHNDLLGTWRIDHWAEAIAQGEHAARAILADLGVSSDPGWYRPRAPFTSTIGGPIVAGAGLISSGLPTRIESADPLVVVNEHNDVPVGVIGIDAAPLVFNFTSKLFATVDPVGGAAQLVAHRGGAKIDQTLGTGT